MFIIEECTCTANIFNSEVFQSIVGGVAVYLIGIFLERLYIAPLTKYNDLRSEISYCLFQYESAYSNPYDNVENADWHNEASKELRKMASKTQAFAQERKFLAKIRIPSKKALIEVCRLLLLLSNNMQASADDTGVIKANKEAARSIRSYLSLDTKL